MIVVSGHFQAAIDGTNAYAVDALEHEWRMFEQATSVPTPVMTALIRDALGLAEPWRPSLAAPAKTGPPRLADGGGAGGAALGGALLDEPVRRLDLSIDSDAVDAGAWLVPGLADRLAAELAAEAADRLAAGPAVRQPDRQVGGVVGGLVDSVADGQAGSVATPYGRPRLDGSPTLAMISPATVPTGMDLWTAAELRAPWAGRVEEASDECVVLVADNRTVTITGPLRPIGRPRLHPARRHPTRPPRSRRP